MIVTKIANPKKSGSKSGRVNGLADYITAPENTNNLEKCIHSECENFITDEYRSQKMEMLALAEGAIKSKDTVDHWVISWQPHERPTVEQARQAVETFMKHTRLEGHQHIWGLHDDTQSMHVHIAVNRVNPDTLKVTKINKGFWKEAGQQVACLIEHEQGWGAVPNARYEIANGKLVKRDTPERGAKPTPEAERMEIQTGEKSAQRIGIEDAGPIIAKAKSWSELHAELAKVGMEYRREGSGAKVYINEIGVKASDVDRKASFSALQKRLGAFQPAKEINRNDYHHHTPQPYLAQNGPRTADSMRSLSKCNLAHSEKGEYGKTKREGVLQLDARSSRQGTGRLRRDTGRSAGRSTGVELKPAQPGWKEYAAIRDERKAEKAKATLELRAKHAAERKALAETQKAERKANLDGINWKGRGIERNALVSSTATLQAADKLDLQARHKAERAALQSRYAPMPQYKAWAAQPRLVQTFRREQREPDQVRHVPSELATTLRALDRDIAANGHITYRSQGKEIFRDEGRSIKVLDLNSNAGIAAALATAQQKFGNTLVLTGSPEFQRNAVAVAVSNGLTCRFTDPTLDKLREQLQAQKFEAERQRLAQERADAEQQRKAQMEKAVTPSKPLPSEQSIQREALTEPQQQPSTGSNHPRPIAEVLKEKEDVDIAIHRIEQQNWETSERPATPKEWEAAAWREAEMQVDRAWYAANPNNQDWPNTWRNSRDVVADQLKQHLAEKRPAMFGGKYDKTTEQLQSALASHEKRLKERQDKALPIAKAIYDKTVKDHAAREKRNAERRIENAAKLKELRPHAEALGKELAKRQPEVQEFKREQKRIYDLEHPGQSRGGLSL